MPHPVEKIVQGKAQCPYRRIVYRGDNDKSLLRESKATAAIMPKHN